MNTDIDVCRECGAPLTAEAKFLNAIFGEHEGLCLKCVERKNMPKCLICGEPTMLSVNGVPRCRVHMGR